MLWGVAAKRCVFEVQALPAFAQLHVFSPHAAHRNCRPLCLLIGLPAGKSATPLMAAAVHGRDDVVSTLLSNGVRVLALWLQQPRRRIAALSPCISSPYPAIIVRPSPFHSTWSLPCRPTPR